VGAHEAAGFRFRGAAGDEEGAGLGLEGLERARVRRSSNRNFGCRVALSTRFDFLGF
jgi:hypothetical protein